MNETNIVFLLHLTGAHNFCFLLLCFHRKCAARPVAGKISQWLARENTILFWWHRRPRIRSIWGAIIAILSTGGLASRLKIQTSLGGGFVYLLIYALAAAALVRLFGGRQASFFWFHSV